MLSLKGRSKIMSKKDYQAIARAIHRTHQEVPGPGASLVLRNVADNIAVVLSIDNPLFDRARFIEACETGHCRGMKK